MNFNREPGPDFIKSELGRKVVYLHREVASFAPQILLEIDRTLRSGRKGAGNRESGYLIDIEGAPKLFVRRSTRGGMMRVLGSVYFGFATRMVHELNVISEARNRGVSVPEPMGAIVEKVSPAVYRGAVLTKAIPGMTLWEFVKVENDPSSLSHVVRMARRAIDTMHARGIFHDDLNLHNLYVSTASEEFDVVILDFDKAKISAHELSPAQRRRNFKRLADSIRKLDPEGRYFDDASVEVLTGQR